MQQIDTAQFIQAVLEFATEHNQEDAYQSVTQLLAMKVITQDQWHEAVQAFYPE